MNDRVGVNDGIHDDIMGFTVKIAIAAQLAFKFKIQFFQYRNGSDVFRNGNGFDALHAHIRQKTMIDDFLHRTRSDTLAPVFRIKIVANFSTVMLVIDVHADGANHNIVGFASQGPVNATAIAKEASAIVNFSTGFRNIAWFVSENISAVISLGIVMEESFRIFNFLLAQNILIVDFKSRKRAVVKGINHVQLVGFLDP